jgi:hypothetical protein
MADLVGLAVHQQRCAIDAAAVHLDDHLVPEADSEDRNFSCEMPDAPHLCNN